MSDRLWMSEGTSEYGKQRPKTSLPVGCMNLRCFGDGKIGYQKDWGMYCNMELKNHCEDSCL